MSVASSRHSGAAVSYTDKMEPYENEGFNAEDLSPDQPSHASATSSEHNMSAYGDTASMSVGDVADVSPTKCNKMQ